MDLIYFGSSDFSVPFLERLDDSSHNVKGVFTYRDKRKGRGRRISANPVKAAALDRGLDIYEIEEFNEKLYENIAGISFDYAVVVSFGMILPEEVFRRWPGMWLNVHPSLLPQYRGPSPMISALLDGASKTGVTINSVVYGVDEGKIYAQAVFNIDKKDNLDSLKEKVVAFGSPLLITVLDIIRKYNYAPVPQGEKGITYTRKINPDEYEIKWNNSAEEISNHIRAFSSRPGAYTIFNGSRLKVLSSSLAGEKADRKNYGSVITADRKNGIMIACGDGRVLSLDLLQPQGKKPMDALSFINGYNIKTGMVLGKS